MLALQPHPHSNDFPNVAGGLFFLFLTATLIPLVSLGSRRPRIKRIFDSKQTNPYPTIHKGQSSFGEDESHLASRTKRVLTTCPDQATANLSSLPVVAPYRNSSSVLIVQKADGPQVEKVPLRLHSQLFEAWL